MNTKKTLAVLLSAALALTLAACGAKTDSEPLPTATPEVTATPEPTATTEPTAEPAESHDFDSAVNKYKTERNIEIKQYSGDSASDMADCDSGTDIEELDTLHDWLYNNGVTRESVQNDRDSGCKNPYLDGYLEYLDSLVDKQIAEDNAGQVESSAKGDGLGGTETINGIQFTLDSDGGGVTQNGIYYDADNIEYIRKAAEKQEAKRAENEALIEQMHKDGEALEKASQDEAYIQDFINELQGNG